MQSIASVPLLHISPPSLCKKQMNNFYSTGREIANCILRSLFAYRFHLKQEENHFLKASYNLNFPSLWSLYKDYYKC